VSEGDIQAAYSAEIFPKVKGFTHNGVILTNGGGFFSGPVAAAANCYPLIPADEYRGPEPCRYTYEGREACYRGDVFKLGPKIVFVATDATVDEWRGLIRSMSPFQEPSTGFFVVNTEQLSTKLLKTNESCSVRTFCTKQQDIDRPNGAFCDGPPCHNSGCGNDV
jgi:hypothetical protein